MIGQYPVIIDGKNCGKLTVSQKGLKYSFEATAKLDTSEIIRLSIYGGEKSAYLGVMQPKGNVLWLYRELSRAELANLPEKIDYVSNQKPQSQTKKQVQKPSSSDDLVWRKNPVGLLWTVQNGKNLCAIPKHFGIAAYGEELKPREIEGVVHRVFVVKNSKN